uniref:ABC transporter ATP-binding protein n=2 Tax=Comamonadaceae TaxID=80864 RepID=UPI00241FD7DE
GAGKTTTLRAICRHLVDTRGEVRLAGERIDRHSTERIARQGVGHVPDGRGTFAQLSAEDNLRLGAQARPTRAARADVGGDMERMFGYFPRLRERRAQQAGTLSGGEQQMLAIARALMGRPRLLLLDEPSFGLAPLVVRDIFGILRRINAEQGTTILLVEQNARLALELAHSAYLLETGRIVLHGPSEAMRRNDAVRQAYLGE